MSKAFTIAIFRPQRSSFEGKNCLKHARSRKNQLFYESIQLSCNITQKQPKSSQKRRFHVKFSVLITDSTT